MEARYALGIAAYEARERADRFRRHNVANLNEMLPFFGDETRRLSAAKAGREQLEKQFAEDRAALDRSVGSWSLEADPEAPSERLPAGGDANAGPESSPD